MSGRDVVAGPGPGGEPPERPLLGWGGEPHDEPRPGRRALIVAAAAAPWLVVAALLLRPGPPEPTAATGATGAARVGGTAGPAGTAPSPATSAAPGAASSGAAGRSSPAQATTVPEPTPAPAPGYLISSAARHTPGAGDAAAVGAVVARSWLDSVGPPLDADLPAGPGSEAYVDHLLVEAVDLPSPGHAVVSLLALVLDADGDRYAGARLVRLAVPVRLDGEGARPAGAPWRLPEPDLTPASPRWSAVDDPDLLADAGTALEATGYRDVEVHRLERSPGWPWRVTATAVAPGTEVPAQHRIWLRSHLGRLTVAGWLPRQASDQGGQP